MQESKHGEMADLPNKVNKHIMERSKHGAMDDLQNKVNEHNYNGGKQTWRNGRPAKQTSIYPWKHILS